jgi:hypothetical protein
MTKKTISFIAVYAFMLTGTGLAQGDDKSLGNDANEEASGQAVQNLSADVQIEEGQSVVAYGNNLNERVSNTLNDARKESDIIRITCLNDKLTQINANLRNAQQRLEALMGAVDRDTRNHEYLVLMVLKQKLKTLDQEAGQCVGQDIFETGNTQVTTEIDPSVANQGETPTQLGDIGPSSVEIITGPATAGD